MTEHAKSDRQAEASVFERFVHSEVAGSVLLLAATAAALVAANSPLASHYEALVGTKVGIHWGDAQFALSVQHWINDLLMVVFFFVVGLEIKRELVVGQLSTPRKAALPIMAALGGMLVPAACYAAFNNGTDGAPGWGIPMATDIAFALGVLAVLGSRVPAGLKVFLTALAIVDDLGAVAVIAAFYTNQFQVAGLVVAAAGLALIAVAGRARVRSSFVYLLLAFGVWAGVMWSGVHATVAGVLVAMLVPVRARRQPGDLVDESRVCIERVGALSRREAADDGASLLDAISNLHAAANDLRPPGLALEESLHPIVVFVILPLFAFFNAGVALGAGASGIAVGPVAIGVALGLVVGKLVGIGLFSVMAVATKLAALPEGVRWPHILGAACLGGIGFTMSLFITELAFDAPGLVQQAKLGVVTASFAAAVIGAIVLVSSPAPVAGSRGVSPGDRLASARTGAAAPN
jgi:Na+:H+ antiporter, NhaA family